MQFNYYFANSKLPKTFFCSLGRLCICQNHIDACSEINKETNKSRERLRLQTQMYYFYYLKWICCLLWSSYRWQMTSNLLFAKEFSFAFVQWIPNFFCVCKFRCRILWVVSFRLACSFPLSNSIQFERRIQFYIFFHECDEFFRSFCRISFDIYCVRGFGIRLHLVLKLHDLTAISGV